MAAALALLGFAGWKVVPQIALLARTKSVQATVVRGSMPRGQSAPVLALIREHDGDGYVIYGLRGTFSYYVNGQKVGEATTPFRTRDVAEILKLRDAYSDSDTHEIRYDPARPETIYIRLGLHNLFSGAMVSAVLGAFVLLIVAMILFRFSRAPKLCTACQAELENYYQFCPGCSATVSAK